MRIKINELDSNIELLESDLSNIGVRFDSSKLDLQEPFDNNGLEKECIVTKVVLDLKNRVILTEKVTHSRTPTGQVLGEVTNNTYVTSTEDTEKFLSLVTPVLVPSLLNGVVDDMKIAKRIYKSPGVLDEELVTKITE